MPWRDLLSLAQPTQLLALPATTPREFEELYTLTRPTGNSWPLGGPRPIGWVSQFSFAFYADRDETRREHLADLLVELSLRTLGSGDYHWPKDTGLRRQKLRPLGVSPQVVPILTSP